MLDWTALADATIRILRLILMLLPQYYADGCAMACVADPFRHWPKAARYKIWIHYLYQWLPAPLPPSTIPAHLNSPLDVACPRLKLPIRAATLAACDARLPSRVNPSPAVSTELGYPIGYVCKTACFGERHISGHTGRPNVSVPVAVKSVHHYSPLVLACPRYIAAQAASAASSSLSSFSI